MLLESVISLCLCVSTADCYISVHLAAKRTGTESPASQVPQLVHYGSKVSLICKYKLGTAQLNTVNWYKDDNHFFTFSPRLRPQTKVFQLPNLYIDESQSDMHRVSLHNVTNENTGNYRCEINTEDTKNVANLYANVTVFAYPDRDPIIYVGKQDYRFREEVIANCTSGTTIPPTLLFWFINGTKAQKKLVQKEEITPVGRFFRTSSNIKFRIEMDSDNLVLGCVASILDTLPVTRTSVPISVHKDLTNHQQSVQVINSSNGKLIVIVWSFLIIIFSSH